MSELWAHRLLYAVTAIMIVVMVASMILAVYLFFEVTAERDPCLTLFIGARYGANIWTW